jgi:hypothetical protein
VVDLFAGQTRDLGGGNPLRGEGSALQRQEHYTRGWCWYVRGSSTGVGSEWCSEQKGEGSADR